MITKTEFKTSKSTHPMKVQRSSSVQEFLADWKAVSHAVTKKKAEAATLSMCEYRPNQARKRENLVGVTGLVLDVASPMDAEALEGMLQRADFAYVAYTRYESKEDAYQIRMIIPMSRPLTPEEFGEGQIVQKLAGKLEIEVTEQCFCITSVFEGPICPPGTEGEHEVVVEDQFQALNTDDLLDTASEVESDESPLPKPSRGAKQDGGKSGDDLPLIIQMIDRFVSEHCGGVEPIAAESNFFFYRKRIWLSLTTAELAQHLFVDIFKKREKLQTVNTMVATMRTQYYKREFPDSINMTKSAFRIALENATIDPMAGMVVPDDPGYYLRTKLAFPFDRAATSPLWLRTLDEIFRDDPDKVQKIAFLQEIFGYLTVPVTHHQVMFWLWGEGSNGKSVILQIMIHLLGKENVSNVSISKLGQRFYIAELVGKLANINDEMGARVVLQDETLKQTISSGRQMAERKGEHPFSFEPFARLVAASNHLPETADTSHGFFRRVKILSFTRRFTEAEADKSLPKKLVAELPGIFNWALEGLQRLEVQQGFTIVPSSVEALNDYKNQANPVAMFVSDILIQDKPQMHSDLPQRTPTGDVYAVYKRYCQAKSFPFLNSSQFGMEMKRLGLIASKSNSRRFYPVQVRACDESGTWVAQPLKAISQSSLEEEME